MIGTPQTAAEFARRVPGGEVWRDVERGGWCASARVGDAPHGIHLPDDVLMRGDGTPEQRTGEARAVRLAWLSYQETWNTPTELPAGIWAWPNGLRVALPTITDAWAAKSLFRSLFDGVDPGAVDCAAHPPLIGYDRPLGPDGPKAYWREFMFRDGTTARAEWPDAEQWAAP